MELDVKKSASLIRGDHFTDIIKNSFFLSNDGHKKRLDIQGLRGFAIIFVICFHFLPNTFPNGYLGVDIFFVLSGYLMALVLSREKKISFGNGLEFYYRRMKRIIPCYYVVIFLTTMAMLLLMSISWVEDNQANAESALLFRTNYMNIANRKDYFRQGRSNHYNLLYFHSWSLCVEVQFYLVVPLIFFFIKNVFEEEHRLCYAALMIAAFSSWNYNWMLFLRPLDQFNDPLSRAWQFLFGILAFYNSLRKDAKEKTLHSKQQIILALFFHITLILILFTGFSTSKFDDFPARSIATATTALALILGSHSQTIFLSNAVLTYIGDISYALYLTHWPTIKIMKYFTDMHDMTEMSGLVIAFLVSIVSAVLLHHLFEKKHLLWDKKTNIIMSIMLFVVAYGTAFFSGEIAQFLVRGPNREAVLQNIKLIHPVNYHTEANYTIFAEFGGGDFWGLGTFPPGNGTHKILVLGDSFSAQQTHAIKRVLAGRYKTLQHFSMLGNQVFSMEHNPRLAEVNRQLIESIKPDILLIVTRQKYWQKRPSRKLFDPLVSEGMQHLQTVSRYSKHVIVAGPHPRYNTNFINLFIDKLQRGDPLDDLHIPLEAYERETQFARIRMKAILKTCKKCQLVDTAAPFTDLEGKRILTFNPKTLLSYADNTDHFTHVALRELIAAYRPYLEPLVNGTLTNKSNL